mmetsp:Transcript_13847/g.16818  ORF Transcript_13847/g.16818 Transcript_13847/m.16818 type:complete len:381 (+) Transcript_13847:122-1264(+)
MRSKITKIDDDSMGHQVASSPDATVTRNTEATRDLSSSIPNNNPGSEINIEDESSTALPDQSSVVAETVRDQQSTLLLLATSNNRLLASSGVPGSSFVSGTAAASATYSSSSANSVDHMDTKSGTSATSSMSISASPPFNQRDESNSSNPSEGDENDLQKIERRLALNRITARERRKRKREHIEELQSTVEHLSAETDSIREENRLLREQIASMQALLGIGPRHATQIDPISSIGPSLPSTQTQQLSFLQQLMSGNQTSQIQDRSLMLQDQQSQLPGVNAGQPAVLPLQHVERENQLVFNQAGCLHQNNALASMFNGTGSFLDPASLQGTATRFPQRSALPTIPEVSSNGNNAIMSAALQRMLMRNINDDMHQSEYDEKR